MIAVPKDTFLNIQIKQKKEMLRYLGLHITMDMELGGSMQAFEILAVLAV